MNFTIIIPAIFWTATFIVVFPFIVSITKIGLLPRPLKIIKIHFILAFLLQAGIIILHFLRIKYLFLIHIYIVEEFVLDMLFYRELLKKTHAFKDQLSKPFYLLSQLKTNYYV